MRTHILGPNFQGGEKHIRFNLLIQFFIDLYLGAKPMILFQDIFLHMDLVIAFWSYTFNT